MQNKISKEEFNQQLETDYQNLMILRLKLEGHEEEKLKKLKIEKLEKLYNKEIGNKKRDFTKVYCKSCGFEFPNNKKLFIWSICPRCNKQVL